MLASGVRWYGILAVMGVPGAGVDPGVADDDPGWAGSSGPDVARMRWKAKATSPIRMTAPATTARLVVLGGPPSRGEGQLLLGAVHRPVDDPRRPDLPGARGDGGRLRPQEGVPGGVRADRDRLHRPPGQRGPRGSAGRNAPVHLRQHRLRGGAHLLQRLPAG